MKKLIDLGENAPAESVEAAVSTIEGNPKAAYDFVLPKLRDAAASDRELRVYVWALGLTGIESAVDDVISLSNTRGDKSLELKGACAQALADLGGAKAGAFLLSQLNIAADKQVRFALLSLLAQMHYEPALPQAMEVLKVDPREFYWQPIFVFGKLGDAAIPLLIKQINSDQPNVRLNAVAVLGQWLTAAQATGPLQEQFWKEADPEIRRAILSALERTSPDLDAIGHFSEDVLAREKDEQVRRFAQQTLDSLGAMKKELQSFRAEKKVDRAAFESEYARLYRTAGKDGWISVLSHGSSPADEPRLKRLRERILRRSSDECLHEYREVSSIILKNRWMSRTAATQPAESPGHP